MNQTLDTNLELQNKSFEIYTDGNNYINQFRLYHAYFNIIPNLKVVRKINQKKLIEWILENLKDEITLKHYAESYDHDAKNMSYDDLFYILNNKVLLNIYSSNIYILFPVDEEEYAINLVNSFLTFIQKPTKKTTEISLIVNGRHGLDTKELEIKKPKIDFKLHYNDDFKNVHDTIVSNIRKSKTQGLYLFHGKPGTGKSTYIKYLMHLQSKTVIFLSPNMAANLDNMALTEFLMDSPNCVLVIEDAEDLIISRDQFHNSKLSFLLNLTDGILGESLGIQIIATFNTDLKNIDKALLRKGRLTAIYEFKELELDKTNALLDKLGHPKSDKPLILADIFNYDVDTNNKEESKPRVGFK